MRFCKYLSFLLTASICFTQNIGAVIQKKDVDVKTEEQNSKIGKDDAGISEAEVEENETKLNLSKIGNAVDELSLYDFYSEDANDPSGKNSGSKALTALKNIKKSKTPFQKSAKKNNTKIKLGKLLGSSSQKNFFVVAKVNSSIITNLDIINAIKFMFFSSGKSFDEKSAQMMVKTVLNAKTDDCLQQLFADRIKIKVTDAEVMQKIADIAKSKNMSVDELEEKFLESGISLEIFKKYVKTKMLFPVLVKIIGETSKPTAQEIQEEKTKALGDLKQTRYHLCEILFRVDDKKSKQKVKENAEAVLKLLKEGFSFQVMAENMSQGRYSGTVGDLGWVREDKLEKSEREAVHKLKRNDYSDVIDVVAGVKILCVLDKADPNKVGETQAKCKVLITDIKYKGGIFTSKDKQKAEEIVGKLSEANSAEQYKKLCKEHKIEFVEKEADNNDPYEMELVDQARAKKKPAVLQSSKDEDSVSVLFLVSEEIPEAKVQSDKELFDQISWKKVEKEFSRNFKRIKSTAHLNIDRENLARVASNK